MMLCGLTRPREEEKMDTPSDVDITRIVALEDSDAAVNVVT
jgi:hypothetical protein